MAYRMRKMTVTKIEEVTKAKCRIEIDQEFAFVLYKGELRMYHIREGEELDPAIYEEIVGKLLPKRATMRAMNLLKSRPYTEYQLRQKLSMGGYPQDAQEEAISYVKSYHYIDDRRYATDYVQYYMSLRSRNRIEMDLIKKGITRDLILDIMTKCYEFADPQIEIKQAMELLHKKHYDSKTADMKEKQRIMGFLYRKGFSQDVIHKVGLFHK